MYCMRLFKFNGHIRRKRLRLLLMILMLLQRSAACSPLQPFILPTGHSESKFGGDDFPYIKANPAACDEASWTA